MCFTGGGFFMAGPMSRLGIAPAFFHRDGKAEDLAAIVADPVRHFNRTAGFDLAKCGEQHLRIDCGDRNLAQGRINVLTQPPFDHPGIAWRPCAAPHLDPFLRNLFKGIGLGVLPRLLFRLSHSGGVTTGAQVYLRFVTPFASVG